MNKFYKANLKIISQKNKNPFPKPKQFKYLPKFLNKREKKFLIISIFLVILSSSYFLIRGYQHINITPSFGGMYSEGIIGQIQYLNPILAYSNNIDMDINKLIYSSLFEHNKRKLEPEIVSTYSISEDQKIYNFKIKDNIYWHDGQKLTVDDVLYTFKLIQDPNYKSPLYVSFLGIKTEKINDHEFKLQLEKPYSPLLSSLTFGILPKHIWENISYIQFPLNELNIKPIGSGPYKFKSLTKSKQGDIKSYTLSKNDNYFNGKPYINEVSFMFLFDTQEAIENIKNKKIDGISYLTYSELTDLKNRSINSNYLFLPQYSAIFFNSKFNELLKERYIREVLAKGTNKQEIIEKVFKGNAEGIETIFLKNMLGYDENFKNYDFDPKEAVDLLQKNGWKRNPTTQIIEKDGKQLELTLTTLDKKDNENVANIIKNQWEKLGIKLNIQLVDSSTIKEEIIKPRNYELLLYGEIIGADSDPYSFWHSSQIQNPGLNLSLYNNSLVDKQIEKARQSTNAEEREKCYFDIQKQIKEDIPAIFLYNPAYIYITTKDLKGIEEKEIIILSDRFNNIEKWYIKTKKQLIKL